MFFAPPQVKSLSRYAEYGAYLGHKHFMAMLGIAIAAHLTVIAIYSMKPKENVIHIPVRALNIKLSGGSAANGIKMPATTAMPLTPGEPIVADDQKAVRDAKPASKEVPKEQKEKKVETPPAPLEKPLAAQGQKKGPEFTLATPKRYVREYKTAHKKAAAKPASGAGNGSGIGGDANGKEMIERYTQTVSQWIKNHQDYARAAYKEAAQGQNKVVGQTVIRLRIDRSGHILFSNVDRTSGNELVDEMAMVMVRASDPVPVVPSDYPGEKELEFLIAVQVDFSKQ